ncbi:MAG: Gfo/Idh/MocA family oxidoreductase [Planctomycetota bacterium]
MLSGCGLAAGAPQGRVAVDALDVMDRGFFLGDILMRQHSQTPARRSFLKATAGATAVAVAAPYVITSTALGNATTPPASDRVVLGGIGIGNQGTSDQNAFLARSDVQYVAVCDVRKNYLQAAKDRVDARNGNGDCATYNDFRELLARDDIDALHIATPDHWHAIMTILACQAGKDLYLQKPETLTLREGPLMVAAARRYGRVVSGGSQRVLEDFRTVVHPAWAGELGAIKTIDVAVAGPSQPCNLAAQEIPPEMDWEMWLGPAPWGPYNAGRCDGNYGTAGNSWRSYIDYSGGSLTDWGAHLFGGAIFAADLREVQPLRATYHPATSVGNMAHYVTLSYPNGAELHHNRPLELKIPTALKNDSRLEISGDGQTRAAKPVPAYKGEGGIYGDFIHCVKTREKPFRDIELAINTMTAPHLVGLAYRLQRSLVWDAATQSFPEDDEANRLCDRARREPWHLS